MATKQITVHAEWDPEAQVWVATSDDVPGLVTEAGTVEALAEKLSVMIPAAKRMVIWQATKSTKSPSI